MKSQWYAFFASAALTTAVLGLVAQTQSVHTLAIRDVRVFDGDRVIDRTTVVVTGGKISAVGVKVAIPKGAEVIDGTGKTLVPGLIDNHVHMADSYTAAGATGLEQATAYGITTVLDMGVSNPDDYQLFKKKVKAGDFPMGADFFTSGVPATVPNGHGDMRHLNPTLTRPEEAQAWVDARVASGSDYIKLMSETFAEHGRNIPTLSDETFAAVVAAAHKRGLLAVAHTLQADRARRAVLAGADVLVHISPYDPPDPDFGTLLASHHTAHSTNLISYAPTSYKLGLSTDPDLAPYMPQFMIDDLAHARPFPDARHEYSMAGLKLLHAAHVPILAATDIGYPYAPLLHAELEIMTTDGGFSPLEALATATANGADRFRLKDRGRIKVGLRADLLLVKGDPAQNIKALRSIVGVWAQGVKIDREAFKARVPSLKAPAGRGGPPPQKKGA